MASDKSLPELFWRVAASDGHQQVGYLTSWTPEQPFLMKALPGVCWGLEASALGEAHTHGSPQVPEGWAHRGHVQYKTDAHRVWK